MGFFDFVKDIPHIAVLKEKITTLEAKTASAETENAILKDDLREAKIEIQNLKDENKRLKDEIDTLTQPTDLDETLVKILIYLGQPNRDNYAQSIAAALEVNPTRLAYYLGELEKQKYLSSVRPMRTRPTSYKLTQKGREFLVTNDLI